MIAKVNNLLMKEIVQAIIAIGLVGTVVYSAVFNIPLDDKFWNALMLIIGYYFGVAAGVKTVSKPFESKEPKGGE